MNYVSSYKTGETKTTNGKTRDVLRVGYFTEAGCVVSFPARLNNFTHPSFSEISKILRGDSIIESDGYAAGRDFAPIATKSFTSGLVLESSAGTSHISSGAESTMTLYRYKNGADGVVAFIDWDIPALDTGESIGLHFDRARRLTDYDGVMCLPSEAVALIRSAGFIVPHDFI